MTKMLRIAMCEECPNFEFRGNNIEILFFNCSLSGRRIDELGLPIPDWCLLEDAPEEQGAG